jgi:ATP-dependent DNA helicase RecG
VITLETPLTAVVGDKATKRKRMADGLGLHTVGDLLRHFPRRYVKAGELTRVADLHEGEMLTVIGEIARSELKPYRDRRSGRTAYRLETVLQTDGPRLKMTFFAKNQHTSQWQASRLAVGRRGVFVGQVSRFRDDWQLTNPKMILFGISNSDEGDGTDGVVDSFGDLYPIYPQTKGVESWDIQRAVNFARSVIDDVPELIPDEVRDEFDLVDARTAVDLVHAPDTFAQVEVARRRYRFEEALVTQVVLARRRAFLHTLGAQARTGGGGLLAAFDERLPFELTGGQREVAGVIEADLAQPHPMNRLLQGEVGSGKTVVALRAMLRVVDSGGQAALLAPTEVLAQQHYRSISAMLGDLAAGGMLGGAADGTSVALLTGSMPKSARAAVASWRRSTSDCRSCSPTGSGRSPTSSSRTWPSRTR